MAALTQRTTTTLVAAVMAATLASACGDDPVEATVPTTVTVTPASVSLQSLDETVQLTATVKDQNGQAMSGIAVAWTSSDPAVGTVDDSGLVTAVGNGTVTVTATAWSASGTAAVMVDQVPTEVLVDPATDTLLTSGDTLRLSADALDSNGNAVAGAVFAWASTDTLVAVVDDEGLVTGVSAGEVEVTATSEGTTGRAQLTVAAPVPTTVTISPDTVAFHALGQTERLAAEVRDQGGRVMEGEAVSWSSADTLVATVDWAGRVTATGGGATTVAATAGSATATAVVTVTQSAGSVVISPPAATIALGDTLRLSAEAFDENGHVVAAAEFEWSSSDLSVVRVDGSGLATAAGEGRATVTAAADGARGTAEITVENPDRAALVALYNATDGPNWVDNTNWLTDAPLGEWYGVETDTWGRVVGLGLFGRWDPESGQSIPHGLTGEIPPELGDLANLRALELGGNLLTGPIPPELGDLANLRLLDLSPNALTGEIPPELGDLANLQRLHLYRNNLTGEIPPELGNLPELESLLLWGNQLSGPIPPQLGNSVSLLWLSLANNDLTGPIPPELGDLQALRGLFLGDNGLTGPIPPELGTLGKLENLGLGGNELGPFPQSFLNLQNIREASADCSPYGVCVPGTSAFVDWTKNLADADRLAFCNASDRAALTDLYEIAAGGKWIESGGWLGGPALEEWHGVETDTLGRVTALVLSNNGLSGSLPAIITQLGQLASLRIDGNELGGRLPLSLTALDLDEFHYDGTDLCEPADAEFREWLDGIPSHRGTAVQCRPLTERDALVAIYEGTGGPRWTNSTGWLTEAPLRRWSGVEVDTQGRVVGLRLVGYGLSGPIPPEVGNLASLLSLDLSWNDLSGPIPPEVGDLASLRQLRLAGNNFAGPMPPDLDALTHLQELNLSQNDLSGSIPPEVGDLANLFSLYLDGNDLSGSIPDRLGGLANLHQLHLHQNGLSGTLPAELGGLANLRELHLHQNRLSGSIPPSFGRLGNLEEMLLAHNDQLGGALPKDLVQIPLQSLVTGGTDLCAPSDRDFQAWLATIPRKWVANCGEALAYLVQGVQSRTHPVPLVAGEGAMLRVFVTARKSTSEVVPPVRARFYLGGTERLVVEIPAGTSLIPTDVAEGELSESANADIPGHIVRPGLEMIVEIDPGGTLDPALGVPRRIPETGRMAVDVRSMPTLDITAIPFLWRPDPDLTVVAAVDGMAADPDGHYLLEDTRILLPVRDVDVTAHEPVFSASNDAFDLLTQTEALRVLEDGRGHYVGMMSGEVRRFAGFAYVPGRSSFSIPRPGVVAHELGHNMGLRHAPCGRPANVDLSFPHPFGAIAAWGYDSRSGTLVSPHRPDLMSYCHPQWISGYHFTNALVYRLKDEAASARTLAAAPTTSLLLWGGVNAAGNPFLNPAFVADAPPALPDSAGDHTLTGRDAAGGELFSLSFTMPEVASEEETGSSFAFVLPVRPGWANALATITLSGPDGSVTLDGATDAPMAILRNPVTGQIRGFLRDLPQETQAAMDAAGRAVEPGLEVLFSRGIPAASEWRR